MTVGAQIRDHIRRFDLPRLFVEDLGWDRAPLPPVSVLVDGSQHDLRAIAQKRGFVAYACVVPGPALPSRAQRWRIEREVAKNSLEHLIVYLDAGRTTQVWEWVRRDGQRRRIRSHVFRAGSTVEALAQKIESLVFDLDEEERLSILDVTARAHRAFDTDRVTKRFYERFRQVHDTFLTFVVGLDSIADREWYASVMLNRLMFVYFIQKKRFLDGDLDYLRNRLRRTQQARGRGQFYTFYRYFLVRLFHEGLAAPEPRAAELGALLGRVPYLNGGLFDVHELEASHPGIDMADEAFELVLDFFDAYEWHLDDRPLRADNEINPDVLGYIFEKYINQRELGAYYTKDDITGYITEKTLGPVLLARVLGSGADAREIIGDLLRVDPRAYLPPSLTFGAWDALPGEVEAGIADPRRRGAWNALAAPACGLVNETWRDVVRRREDAGERIDRLSADHAPTIEELISLNVDFQQLLADYVARCTELGPVEDFLQQLTTVSVLDPACGSGAFLFSALEELERLYLATLDRLDDLGPEPASTADLSPSDALRDAPNRRYAVLKAIVLNNLFGVDVVEEAVEICKLRLFLKLVAQIDAFEALEPLPDVDFNIRAGNSLVGFASRDSLRGGTQVRADLAGTIRELERRFEEVDHLTSEFRASQDSHSADERLALKGSLRRTLDALRDELDAECARTYGVAPQSAGYGRWRKDYQPFHWFLEFHEILASCGFDAIVGNPPYIELRNLTTYSPRDYRTSTAGNLYAMFLERANSVVHAGGRQGFIVPVSSVSTDRYVDLQSLLAEHNLHFSSFDDRPSRLFDGLEHVRLTIHLIGQKSRDPVVMSTRYHKWTAEERPALFQVLRYADAWEPLVVGSLPKTGSPEERGVADRLRTAKRRLAMHYVKHGSHAVYYTRKVGYFLQILDFVPEMRDGMGRPRLPSELKELRFASESQATLALACLSSTLFYWFVTVHSDCRNLNKREIDNFPVDLVELGHSELASSLIDTTRSLMANLISTSELRTLRSGGETLTVQFIYPRQSKHLIDRIDQALGTYYGLSDAENDFIQNYEIKYRLGVDDEDDGS